MKLLADTDNDGTAEYEFQLKLVRSVDLSSKQESTTLPLPGQSADSSLVQAFQGESEEFTIQVILYNDGTDKANGTAPQDGTYSDITDTNADGTSQSSGVEDVTTLQEQVDFLRNYIKDPGISNQNAFEGYPLLDGVQKQGRVVEVSPNTEAQSPAHIPCSIRFVVGQVIG